MLRPSSVTIVISLIFTIVVDGAIPRGYYDNTDQDDDRWGHIKHLELTTPESDYDDGPGLEVDDRPETRQRIFSVLRNDTDKFRDDQTITDPPENDDDDRVPFLWVSDRSVVNIRRQV